MFTRKATDKELICVGELKTRFPPSMLDPADADYLNDNTYLRFARARKADIAKASEMLRKAIEWRKEAKPFAVREEDVKETAKHLQISCGGYCKDGCPIVVLAAVDPDGLTMEARKKFLIFMLEETARKGYDRITWILTWGHMAKEKEKREDKESNAKQHRKEAMQIMQDYYPERVNRILIFHTPFLIRMMLPFMKMSINSETSSKIHNIGSNVKDMDKYITREQLPQICEGLRENCIVEHFGAIPPASEAVQ